MKVITMCLWRRLDIAKRTVGALAACDGIKDYHLVLHIDGNPCEHMVSWARSIGCCSKELLLADKNLGCNASTRRALRGGFERGDYVIHVEEDVLLAKDALRYFEWAQQFRSDPTLLTVGAWRHPRGWLYEDKKPFPMGHSIERQARKSPHFHCWGWATWKDRWQWMDGNWTNGDDQSLSWDVRINKWRHTQSFVELLPLVSRAINIGIGGIHRDDAPLSYWAGSNGFVFPKSYQLYE